MKRPISPDLIPAATDADMDEPPEDLDDAPAWLEKLAARQGGALGRTALRHR
ncbi:MAG: hypothetical protein M5U34_35465 [Chloroflexi bacterium]|nr:hypothetical protein [Chloroflexota bacterium]